RRFYGVGTQTWRHGRRYSKAGSVMAMANLAQPPSVLARHSLTLNGTPTGHRYTLVRVFPRALRRSSTSRLQPARPLRARRRGHPRAVAGAAAAGPRRELARAPAE